jgi:hypothetical protein
MAVSRRSLRRLGRLAVVLAVIYMTFLLVVSRPIPRPIGVGYRQAGLKQPETSTGPPSDSPPEILERSPVSRLQDHNAASARSVTVENGSAYGLRPDWVVYRAVPLFTKRAYVLVLSNEAFVDGALVMGRSLKNTSVGLGDGSIQLCIVVTSGRLSAASLQRLLYTDFDVVVEVPSLAVRVPDAGFKDTFDKSYIFALTCYNLIVFMDADMVSVRSPDKLFEKTKGKDENWVGAIGFRDGKQGDYFQTGMMVIRPSAAVFASIMEEFNENVPPKGHKYTGMNGRDGVLLRSVFRSRFVSIDNKFSRNLDPRKPISDELVCLHLRGKHKPWFDWTKPVTDPEGKKEFGFTYLKWWEIYEAIHYSSAEYQAALRGEHVLGYGGKFSGPGVTPLTHVWMMRNTSKEYVQLLSAEDRKVRDLSPSGFVAVAGKLGDDCVATCSARGLRCTEAGFSYTQMQSCDKLRAVFGCTNCQLAVYWRPHPARDFPGFDARVSSSCLWNMMRDERSKSTCAARNETTARFCPCSASV